jgi:TolA-binding protein
MKRERLLLVNRFAQRVLGVLAVGGLLGLAPLAGAAPEIDREFIFASQLIELGFPDLANRVVERVLREHPGEGERGRRIQGEILVAQRRYDEAVQLMEEMPAGHPQRYALQLQIANGYFRTGDMDNARAVFDGFFGQFGEQVPRDPDLLRLYQDAAYRYGQMLERVGLRVEAAASYERALKAGIEDRNARRALQIDLARLYLRLGREAEGAARRRHLDRSFKLCEDVQWGGYDVWFGRSISIMANVELARGNAEAARGLLRRYMSDMNRLDRVLREQGFPAALSPVADARFLLGQLYEQHLEEMRRQGAPERELLPVFQAALTEYYNVFAQYGGSEFGAESAERGRRLVDLLREEYGREVSIDFSGHLGEAAAAQFQMADDFFRQQNYERAITEYLRILNSFPEGDNSLRALANLLLCYVRTDNELYVRMMVAYLSERFAGQTTVGNALLLGGREYVEKKNEEMYTFFFDRYFDAFPEHERAPALLVDLARRYDEAGRTEEAAAYYRRIIETYPRHRFALRALYALGLKAQEAGDQAEAVEFFTRYVAATRPGHDRVRGQFLLADSHRRAGDYREAIQAYGQILRWLNVDNPPDNATDEDAVRNAEMVERALLFIADCYRRMTDPPEQVPAFRNRALAAYDQFIELHPESTFTPQAMRGKGATQLAMGQSDEAAATFEALARDFPDSAEGRSALFSLVNAAFDIGRPDIAQDAFRRMTVAPEDYTPEEFTRIGNLLLEAGLYEDVIPAYRQVLANSDNRQMQQMALFGLGQALVREGQPEDAAEMLRRLVTEFPQSAFLFDAKFLLAEALQALGQHDAAQVELSDIIRLTQDNVVNQRAQYQMGGVQRARGDLREALGTFQRIALLQDPTHPELGAVVESSLFASLEIMLEMGRFDDVDDVAQQYLSDFPRAERIPQVRALRDEARRRRGGQ